MHGMKRNTSISPLSKRTSGPYEVVPESVQYLYCMYSKEVVHLTKELCLREEGLTSIPLVMRNFRHLQRLDLSYNLLRALPVMILNEYFPSLTALDVSYNRLDSIDNVKQLGCLPVLQELNLLGNPLLAVNQRPLLLSLLIFQEHRPTRDELQAMLGYSNSQGRTSKGQEASGNIVASESISRMLVAGLDPGNVLPRVAVARLSRAGLHATSKFAVYCDLSAAPVPRDSPFPFLVMLNEQGITKEDLDGAARMAPKKDALKAKTAKTKKLMGKRRMEELEKFTETVENAYRERKIAHTLKKLLQDGVIDDSIEEEEGEEEEEEDLGEMESSQEPGDEEPGDEDLLSVVAERTLKLKSVSSLLEGRLSMMEEQTKEGVTDDSFEHVDFSAKTNSRQRQTTCPASWWDEEWMLNDGTLQEKDLPTRLSVVEQGADELERTKKAVERFMVVGHDKTSQDKVAVESKYQSLREEVDDVKRKENASNMKASSSSSALRAKQYFKLKNRFDFSDVLRWELSNQKEEDSAFLARQLPQSLKRLNVEEWMMQETTAVAHADEIDRLFTATNIENKVDTHRVSKVNSDTIFFQRKMASQNEQQNFVEKWLDHRNRLSLIKTGRWPTSSKVRRSSERFLKDSDGSKTATGSELGEEQKEVVQESSKSNLSSRGNSHVILSRALDKLERTLSPSDDVGDANQGSKPVSTAADVPSVSRSIRTQSHRRIDNFSKMFDLGINHILLAKVLLPVLLSRLIVF
eukprot:768514-Hanusia_phi.AAC.5